MDADSKRWSGCKSHGLAGFPAFGLWKPAVFIDPEALENQPESELNHPGQVVLSGGYAESVGSQGCGVAQ
jgi:hypothetical protein